MGPSGRCDLCVSRCGGRCIPAATECLAQRHERLKARQAVLRELVPGCIQSALRFQQREKVARSPLIAQLRSLESALALRYVPLLEFAHRVEVLHG